MNIDITTKENISFVFLYLITFMLLCHYVWMFTLQRPSHVAMFMQLCRKCDLGKSSSSFNLIRGFT